MTRNNFQDGAEFSAEGLDAIVNSADNEGFESGGAPSVGTGNFDVDLTAADYVINQTEYSTGADTVTLSNPSASDRVDIITATTTPGFSVTEGTPGTDPNAPTIPTDEVLIAAVFVDSGAASLASGDINDYRVFLERDAVTYKGNDIDTDGDGKVNDADAADLADDSNQLNSLSAGSYEPFSTTNNYSDLTTATGSASLGGSDTVLNLTTTSGILVGGVYTTEPGEGDQLEITVDGGATQTFTQGVTIQSADSAVGPVPPVRFETSLNIVANSGGTGEIEVVVHYVTL